MILNDYIRKKNRLNTKNENKLSSCDIRKTLSHSRPKNNPKKQISQLITIKIKSEGKKLAMRNEIGQLTNYNNRI